MQALAIGEVQGLHSAIAALGDRDVPPATGLTLAKARRQLQDHLQDYHSVRRDILERHAVVKTNDEGDPLTDRQGNAVLETGDEGEVIFESDEAEETAQEELIELRSQMVEVPILPLPSDLLDGVSDLPYSILDTLALYMEDE